MVIDAHCHAGSGDGMTGPWDTRADLTDYLRRCTAAGIARSVIFTALGPDYAAGNEEVARIVQAHRGRLMGFVFLDGRMPEAQVQQQLARHVLLHGFRGIKCHKHDAPISRAICRQAALWRLPVLYDVMGDVGSIELFAREYPGVNFIIPHLGSFADDWKAQLAIVDHLQRHPNVYTDTAGCRRFDAVVEAVRRGGAHKVLFGSDGPWLHPGLELEKIRLLGLPPTQAAQVCGGNLLRLIGQHSGVRRQLFMRYRSQVAVLAAAV